MTEPEWKFQPKKSKKFTAGIDPDLTKPGVAVWNSETKNWDLYGAIPNEDVVERLLVVCPPGETKVFVEAGWLIKKKNIRGGNYGTAQAKAHSVGQNAASGKILIKMLVKAGYDVYETPPVSKMKGMIKTKKGSWTPFGRKFISDRTGIKKRLSDDVRDALLIVENFK